MKNGFLMILAIISFQLTSAQADSNFTTRVINFECMPDGKNLVLGIMKFDNSRKNPPVRGVFLFNSSLKKPELIIPDGASPAPSPDGNTLAFEKRINNRGRIYLYDLKTKQEKELNNDTASQSSPQWSPDGKTIVYTKQTGSGSTALMDILAIDMTTKEVTTIAPANGYRNYNPVWSSDGKRIVYYLEKGDNHDQIYLTDQKGSFHKNITNDTATHNYYPSWYGNKILYTWSPNRLTTITTDGTNREVIDGIQTFFARFNSKENQIVYIYHTRQEDALMVYDVKSKTSTVLLDGKALMGLL